MLKHVDYVMVVVSDMNRSVRFYRDTLGLPLKFESNEWTEFQTGTTTLALHGGGTPQPRSEKQDRSSKVAGTCSIGFTVENLDETFERLKLKGVPFVMPPTFREGEGIRLAVALDPDGFPISFAEMISQTT